MSDSTSLTPSKPKKSDKSVAKSASKSASKSSAEAASGSKSATNTNAPTPGKSAKERAAAGHSISYFSSISTDEYRTGWDAIFGKTKTPAPQVPQAPTTITLAPGDLDQGLRARLREAFQNKAGELNLDFERLEASSGIDWRLECTYTPRTGEHARTGG